ncbi:MULTISPECIES: VCBS repeat-containing protein [unclassified Frankia]|uniref:FG-GAP repeat domain-containing protein n=1 Tax=unclassified Frankia TaxID=2632575 RepID=UPI001EF6C62D|nr:MULTISPECIES: VCBS repeat-containing protein [unclassified Frankia]
MTALEPDELRRLLTEAVEPVQASPAGYHRIRAGVIRRRRLRMPMMTVGGLALAGLIGLVYLVIEPRTSATLVEPARPPLTQTTPDVTVSRRPVTPPGHGGTLGGGPGRPSAPVSRLETAAPPTSPGGPGEETPSAASTSHPSGTPSNVHSPALPPPVSVPAMAGDVDGDGKSDPATVSDTTVVVALSLFGSTSVTFPAVASPLSLSVFDIDADGYGELIVQTDSNGSTRNFGVAKLTQTGQLRIVSNSPLHAGLNGAHGDGFRCEAGKVVVAAGDRTTDKIYQVTSTTWELISTGFTALGSPTSSTVDLASAQSPFTAGCGIA